MEPKNFGFLGLGLGFGPKPKKKKILKPKPKPKTQRNFGFSELNFRKINVSIHHSIRLGELIVNIPFIILKMLWFKRYGVPK